MNVAVPCEKHSGRLGQLASSQTDASFLSLRISLIRVISGFARIRTRIQSGFRGMAVVGITLTGIRRTLSAPLSFSPGTMRFLSTIRALSFWDRHHTRLAGSGISVSCSMTSAIGRVNAQAFHVNHLQALIAAGIDVREGGQGPCPHSG